MSAASSVDDRNRSSQEQVDARLLQAAVAVARNAPDLDRNDVLFGVGFPVERADSEELKSRLVIDFKKAWLLLSTSTIPSLIQLPLMHI